MYLHPDPANTMADVSVRLTRAGGATALLCAGVDSDILRMVGRWKSDEMFRYLHVQAHPIMNSLATAMLNGGKFPPHACLTTPRPADGSHSTAPGPMGR